VHVEMDRGHMHIVMRACACLTGRMHVRIPPAVHACAHPSRRPTPITHEADEGIFTARGARMRACVCVYIYIFIYIYIYIYMTSVRACCVYQVLCVCCVWQV
jgi:hypothetical protein